MAFSVLNKLSQFKNWSFWTVLFVAFYYQSLRYPFSIGILDAPLEFILPKYIIITAVGIISANIFRKKIIYFHLFEWVTIALFALLGFVGVVFENKFYLQASFAGLASFYFVQCIDGKISYKSLELFMVWAMCINFIYYFAEFLGLLLFDFAFAASMSSVLTSRFGGFIVEPLSAPFFLALFFGISLDFLPIKRTIVIMLSLIALIATHTLTGWIFFIILFAGTCIRYKLNKSSKLYPISIILLTIFFVFIILYLYWNNRNASTYFTQRWHSINLHANFWWPIDWPIFPVQLTRISETWLVLMIEGMGIVFTAAYAVYMFRLCYQSLSTLSIHIKANLSQRFHIGLFVGFYLAILFVIFGSLNQLYPTMFPTGFIFMMFNYLIYYNKISSDS